MTATSAKKEIVFVESNTSGHGIRAIGVAQQELGLAVRFLAANPNLFRNGQTDPLQSVDQLIITDTYDVEAMMQVIDPEQTVGVVAWDDYHLPPACEIAGKLGLYRPNMDGVIGSRFKDLTRIRLQEQGEQSPQFVVVTEEATDSPIGYPCVFKPVDDSGSVGVRICQNQADFQAAMDFVRARTRNVRGYELARRWLVEEYVEGPEYSAELLHINGEWRLLGVTQKLLTPPPYTVEVGHLFPAPLPADAYERIQEKVLFWLKGIGLDSGAAHVEFRLTEKGPVLMEINPRVGGDMITELIRIVYGFDIVKYLLQVAIGEEPTLQLADLKPTGAAAIFFVVSDQTGVVQEVRGKEQLLALPSVV
ncbi:MAG: ATP-grasp domain-containing protein, partial [Tumebacillaceae bacterium]